METLTPKPGDIEAWKSNLVTAWFFNEVENLMSNECNLMAEGGCLNHENAIITQTLTAQATGAIEAYGKVFMLSTPQEAESEDESEEENE